MNIVLISTYELGHQPFGLASPAAWLRAQGDEVACLDLSRADFDEAVISQAGLIAFYVPMHTATRLASRLVERVRELNPHAHLCFYGLYAPVNEAYLRALGVGTILGGEFEAGLARLAASLSSVRVAGLPSDAGNFDAPAIALDRLDFLVPDRADLPALSKYAHVVLPGGRSLVAGYTEASRGCKHLCRHCPIVPVYNGTFRVVPREVVLEDIRRQVAAGAEHITFGDPDFFNGPTHGLTIVQALHREWPSLSYDVTIKVEHLLRHAEDLPLLRDTGCLFVTSAVESVDDATLLKLAKNHTQADFLEVLEHFRELGLALQPTFVPFTPWTTLEAYRDLLALLSENDLVEHVAPIQLGIRLLIPEGSRLLELAEVGRDIGPFDAAALFYPWKHGDDRLDSLALRIQEIVAEGDRLKRTRSDIFAQIWRAAAEVAGDHSSVWQRPAGAFRAAIPHFSEPWYCCAEPTQEQFVAIAAKPPAKKPQAQPSVRPDAFV